MDNIMSVHLVNKLRQDLHNCAELSEHELHTQDLVAEFLRKYSKFVVHRKGKYLYAAYEQQADFPAIAFRADMDAIPAAGQARHGCGHDGHMAILCGLAMQLSVQPPQDKNIYLLFQHAEETGVGACEIVADGFIQQHNIKEIYGLHNIPGVQLGKVICRQGIFACTSKGITIKLTGTPSHAAYPENGINPAYAFAKLIDKLQTYKDANYQGLVLCTIIHLQVGEKAFGTAAAHGELSLTIRAEYEQDLQLLEDWIKKLTQTYSQKYSLIYDFTGCDEFPETISSEYCVCKLKHICQQLDINFELMAEPMRWSEDFGYYTKKTAGAFFGIGAGVTHAQLHTAGYEFPDELIPKAIMIFTALANAKLL